MSTEKIHNRETLSLLEDSVICRICLDILNKPIQCSCCQNSFCSECISKFQINSNFKCPNKCANSEMIKPSLILKNLLSKLKFNCCDTIIPYEDMSNHLKICNEVVEDCWCCNKKTKRKNIKFKLESINDKILSYKNEIKLINSNKQQIKDDYIRLIEGDMFIRMISIIPNTNNIIVCNTSNKSNQVKTLKFSALFGLEFGFPVHAATLNWNKLFYISGGYNLNENSEEDISQKFFMIVSDTLDMLRLPDMLYERKNHSMIIKNKIIYAISSLRNHLNQMYIISKQKWYSLPIRNKTNNITYSIKKPKLAFNNDSLYCFTELLDQEFVIDKIDLSCPTISNNTWQEINFKKKNLNLQIKLSWSGIISTKNDGILLLGELNNDKKIYSYDFINNSFNEESILFTSLNQSWKFRESNFSYLGNENYGLFNKDNLFVYYNLKVKEKLIHQSTNNMEVIDLNINQ